jgi:hypothetical protein
VPANVYVKKTALGQQTIDLSGLAAPSAERGEDRLAAAPASPPPRRQERLPGLASPRTVPLASVRVVAKPANVKVVSPGSSSR